MAMENKILTTNDYKQFKFFDGNAKIKSAKVAKIIQSIKKYGQINVVVINQYGEIIDGQHRVHACMALGIPIRYVIRHTDNNTLVDMVRDINSVQKNWSNTDIGYALSIRSENTEDYKKYLKLIDLGVSHSTVLEACTYLASGEEQIRNSYFDFKNGKLEIPDSVYEKVRGQILMLKNSKIEKKVWNRIYFIRALLKLRRQQDFDVYKFVENFDKYPHQWKNAYTVEENIKSIISVHNYQNRNKAKYYIT